MLSKSFHTEQPLHIVKSNNKSYVGAHSEFLEFDLAQASPRKMKMDLSTLFEPRIKADFIDTEKKDYAKKAEAQYFELMLENMELTKKIQALEKDKALLSDDIKSLKNDLQKSKGLIEQLMSQFKSFKTNIFKWFALSLEPNKNLSTAELQIHHFMKESLIENALSEDGEAMPSSAAQVYKDYGQVSHCRCG